MKTEEVTHVVSGLLVRADDGRFEAFYVNRVREILRFETEPAAASPALVRGGPADVKLKPWHIRVNIHRNVARYALRGRRGFAFEAEIVVVGFTAEFFVVLAYLFKRSEIKRSSFDAFHRSERD